MVKLDKMTGKTVWTSKELSDTAAYSSIARRRRAGRAHLHDVHGSGRRRRQGLGWQAHVPVSEGGANDVANVATPVYFENKVFFASGYGTGGGLLNLTVKTGRWRPTEVYFTREMKNHHGGMVLVDGYLYGYND